MKSERQEDKLYFTVNLLLHYNNDNLEHWQEWFVVCLESGQK